MQTSILFRYQFLFLVLVIFTTYFVVALAFNSFQLKVYLSLKPKQKYYNQNYNLRLFSNYFFTYLKIKVWCTLNSIFNILKKNVIPDNMLIKYCHYIVTYPVLDVTYLVLKMKIYGEREED